MKGEKNRGGNYDDNMYLSGEGKNINKLWKTILIYYSKNDVLYFFSFYIIFNLHPFNFYHDSRHFQVW